MAWKMGRPVAAGWHMRLTSSAIVLRDLPTIVLVRPVSTHVSPPLVPGPIKPELKPLNFGATQQPTRGYPLSVLSNGALLRSTLIATISSHKFLLLPALYTLSFLCKPFGGALLDVDRNPVLHRIMKTTFYNQFCAGETPAETKECVQRLKSFGFRGVILTYAKETLYDYRTQQSHHFSSGTDASVTSATDSDIESWKNGCMETASQLSKGDFLAIKLTGAGQAVTSAFTNGSALPKQMLDAIDEICLNAQMRGISVIVDAESQYYQKEIDRVVLAMMRKYNTGGTAVIYNTYQAYLKSTTTNVISHLTSASEHGFTLGLKVVRGAYLLSDPRSLIHDTKEDTDAAYDNIAKGALTQQLGDVGGQETDRIPWPSVKLLLCSHNRKSLFSALEVHQQRVADGLPTVPIAFGQLHGMSDEVSFSLLQAKNGSTKGPDVFKCSTWGTLGECLAYLVRRAVENQSAVLRTSDEHIALKKECWRRMKKMTIG